MGTLDKAVITTGKTSQISLPKSTLNMSDLEIQHYVRALEAENLKCIKKIAKLQAEHITYKNRIRVLEKQIKDSKPSFFDIVEMSDEQPTKIAK